MRRPAERLRRSTPLALAGLLAALLFGEARADSIDDASRELARLRAEVTRITAGLKPADASRAARGDADVSAQITAAQKSFAAGNYDAAALELYDVVDRHAKHRDHDRALYYLAESLFQKGDHTGARTFFSRLATGYGARSGFYRQALERLIELTLLIDDGASAGSWLAALDKVPGDEARSSVPYIRGKYHHFRGEHPKAIAELRKVAATSPHHIQARYILGVALTASGELDAAAKTFAALLEVRPKTAEDRQVIELCRLALGRLHYERDKPSRAIDAYLDIDRKSKRFPEALFEAAWVYVRNKDYDKALDALELLALSDPKSHRMPEVRILEGNLRIRRAKELEIKGASDEAEVQYKRAEVLFVKTRAAFKGPHAALVKLAAGGVDHRALIAQLGAGDEVVGEGRRDAGAGGPLPEVALSWLRREPAVKRIIAVAGQLDAIGAEIGHARAAIDRLARVLDSPARVAMFPRLAKPRARAVAILEKVMATRRGLVARAARTLGGGSAELAELSRARSGVERELAASIAGRDRASADRKRARLASEIAGVERQVGAVTRDLAAGVADKRRVELEGRLAQLRSQLTALRAGLESLASAETGAAGAGEPALRGRLIAALDAETRALGALAGGTSAARAAAAVAEADRTAASVTALLARIDTLAGRGTADLRRELEAESTQLAAYTRELDNHRRASADLAAATLDAAVASVTTKLREILARADVGVVDVAWSRQEEASRRHRKLTVDQARQLRTLESDFAEILGREAP